MNLRALAAKVVFQVLEKGISLSVALPEQQRNLENGKDKALLAELCYGVMRYLPQLDKQVSDCMSKQMKGKQRIVHQLLLVGCYQLYFTRIPSHAAISETAEACRQLKFEGLVKVVNGVLRNIQRQEKPLATDNDTLAYNTPAWIIKRLKEAYPDSWQNVIEQSHERPPMWLRNNQQSQTRETYLQALAGLDIEAEAGNSPDSILLSSPRDVMQLPGFETGAASVQDGAAQWAATLLAPQGEELVLDACAAPGGKSCHLLELAPNIKLVAVDFDAKRLERVQQNLDRLSLTAEVIHGDAADIDSWWQGEKFDRILLDAPCSATGVIRRHPDIKWLRKNNDIEELAQLQSKIFDHCWKWLKPGGTLLYATCSILPQENKDQVSAFLARTPDATLVPIEEQANPNEIGWQIVPGQNSMDGFYYARLVKD
ncbi:16S rRNA (cytosine(967)-C(5))-methyltransferase RsmB [Shewanella fidelis]|uniref:16S rRNA (cytosine(967)-C(5))-methyltransferase n=1 Tax=Shewanella fidelis TaxID=173509 RepID=A0AAW8NSP4_9GAMM|nr:16S rRNA (cytosine(967)-C(5))-methyltransferase RsmB [Shewanella fidelis]MDR8525837.1 16S rRNA (cytosine(967)-C(5))-methyltransferase RsmB [Shewanella fidelis]MDW4813928.1 16S rRNA (cytosine(967)-C(5))-methyltransferase RsmB [Shewanella fidelis]MDW4818071.1 16S rRNA (cytosine(967)-C(5))-methyltransferase RsmB [Shewanella fidelis]MDW4822091.1 16S rRNA (cytosine(967)-C(5))-methyltransferase RsmB [Shewanella fidelis]MDW4826304.1 16S rRNA (cytosine(967)-C(5))-methyltransferase RsmB [Shewanella 